MVLLCWLRSDTQLVRRIWLIVLPKLKNRSPCLLKSAKSLFSPPVGSMSQWRGSCQIKAAPASVLGSEIAQHMPRMDLHGTPTIIGALVVTELL